MSPLLKNLLKQAEQLAPEEMMHWLESLCCF
jgi:hypothetical protein